MTALLLTTLTGCQPPRPSASVSCDLPVKGVSLAARNGIDYAHLDRDRHRIYVAHDDGMEVWNADNGAPVGRIRGIHGASAIATLPSSNRGFATSRTTGTIWIFDADTLDVIDSVARDTSSDSVAYDPTTDTVAMVNTGAPDVRLIDATTGTVVGKIPLPGNPKTISARGDGKLDVRLEHPARLVRIDLDARPAGADRLARACLTPRTLASHQASIR